MWPYLAQGGIGSCCIHPYSYSLVQSCRGDEYSCRGDEYSYRGDEYSCRCHTLRGKFPSLCLFLLKYFKTIFTGCPYRVVFRSMMNSVKKVFFNKSKFNVRAMCVIILCFCENTNSCLDEQFTCFL